MILNWKRESIAIALLISFGLLLFLAPINDDPSFVFTLGSFFLFLFFLIIYPVFFNHRNFQPKIFISRFNTRAPPIN